MKKRTLAAFIFLSILLISTTLAVNITDTRSAEDILEKEIQIPENLQLAARIVFGVKEQISVSLLVIMALLWAMVFVVLLSGTQLIDLFKGWKAVGIAIILTTIGSASGVLKHIALLFLNIGDIFSFIGRWSPGALLFSAVVIGVVAFVLTKVLRRVRRGIEKAAAEAAGEKIGTELGFLARFREYYKMGREL
jgi:hypothetical protein